MHNTQLVDWEHMCGRFLLLINIFDVCMMSEVVWKFFLLLFALLFAKSFLFGVHEEFCSTVVCVTVHD